MPTQDRYISRSGDNPINDYIFAGNDPVNRLTQTPSAPQRNYVEALPVPTAMPAPGPVLVNRDGEPPQMKTFMNYDAAQLDALHLYHLDSGAVLTANMPYVGGRDQQLQKLGLDPAITVSAGITLSDGTPMTYYSDGTKSVFAMNPLAVSRRSYFSEAQYVNVKTIYFNNLQAISDYYKRTMTFVQVSGMVAEGVAGGGPAAIGGFAGSLRPGPRQQFEVTARPEAPAINPRLTNRLEAWRTYKAGGGAMDMQTWVRSTQSAPWGTGIKSGYANWLRSVESTHGNSALSSRTAYLYRLESADGSLLKWGVTDNLKARYSAEFLKGKNIFPIARGVRRDILRQERDLVETDPGPLNLERWAGIRRGAKR